MNRERLYPYLVRLASVADASGKMPAYGLPIGHGIAVVIAEDAGGATRFPSAAELSAAGLDAASAHQRAMDNLVALCRRQEFAPQLLTTERGRRFIVWHSHWLAAACIRLPYLWKLAAKHLQTDQILASIPHEAAMLLFPRADPAARDEMRALIRENESDARKPLTFALYSVTPDGVAEFHETP